MSNFRSIYLIFFFFPDLLLDLNPEWPVFSPSSPRSPHGLWSYFTRSVYLTWPVCETAKWCPPIIWKSTETGRDRWNAFFKSVRKNYPSQKRYLRTRLRDQGPRCFYNQYSKTNRGPLTVSVENNFKCVSSKSDSLIQALLYIVLSAFEVYQISLYSTLKYYRVHRFFWYFFIEHFFKRRRFSFKVLKLDMRRIT